MASVGGVQSLYNADSAAGHHVVIVVSAISLDDYLQGKLDDSPYPEHAIAAALEELPKVARP